MRIVKRGEETVESSIFSSDEEVNDRLNQIAFLLMDIRQTIADNTGVEPDCVVLAGVKLIFVANKGIASDHGGVCSNMAVAVNRVARPQYRDILTALDQEGLIP